MELVANQELNGAVSFFGDLSTDESLQNKMQRALLYQLESKPRRFLRTVKIGARFLRTGILPNLWPKSGLLKNLVQEAHGCLRLGLPITRTPLSTCFLQPWTM